MDIDPRADVYMDLTQQIPFPDEFLDGIFCEEVIEHLDYPQGVHLLRDCYRALKPGGLLRISTPDLEYFAQMIRGDIEPAGELLHREIERVLGGPISGPATIRNAAVNSFFYGHQHRYLYMFGCLIADSHAERFRHPPEMSLYADGRK